MGQIAGKKAVADPGRRTNVPPTPFKFLAQWNNLFGSDIFIIEKSCVMANVDEIFWNYCELIKSVFKGQND